MSGMRARYLVVAMAGLLLGGCGLVQAGDGTGPSTPAGSAPAAEGSASGAPKGGDATELRVDKSYWHRGFKVVLGLAKIVPGTYEPRAVTIEATFQNLSTEYDGQPTAYALLSVGDRTYSDVDDQLTELPEVPAQRSQPGRYAFVVDEAFTLADAVFIVGKPGVRQATVPLGRTEGLVTLEPKPVPVTGKVTREKTGSVYMSVASVEVRSDEPYIHDEAPTGMEFVRLNFSATNNSNAGFAWVFDRELQLKLPDGTAVGAAGCSRAQILPEPHSTAFGGMACFLVPTPASGTYTFIWDTYAKGALKVPIT